MSSENYTVSEKDIQMFQRFIEEAQTRATKCRERATNAKIGYYVLSIPLVVSTALSALLPSYIPPMIAVGQAILSFLNPLEFLREEEADAIKLENFADYLKIETTINLVEKYGIYTVNGNTRAIKTADDYEEYLNFIINKKLSLDL